MADDDAERIAGAIAFNNPPRLPSRRGRRAGALPPMPGVAPRCDAAGDRRRSSPPPALGRRKTILAHAALKALVDKDALEWLPANCALRCCAAKDYAHNDPNKTKPRDAFE